MGGGHYCFAQAPTWVLWKKVDVCHMVEVPDLKGLGEKSSKLYALSDKFTDGIFFFGNLSGLS